MLVNTKPLREVRAHNAAEDAEPVRADFAPPGGPPSTVPADVLDRGPVVRHAPDKPGRILGGLAEGRWEPGESGR